MDMSILLIAVQRAGESGYDGSVDAPFDKSAIMFLL
jgi:hypothetical protein